MANNPILRRDVANISLITNKQIRFKAASGFSPVDAATNWTIGTPLDVLLILAGVLNTEGRQSTKVDLGTLRAPEYALFGCVDFTGETPTGGRVVEYYWAPSTHNTTANGNVAGNSGLDGDAPAGAVPSGLTLAEFVKLCKIHIGNLTLSDDGSVQNGFVGIFSPPTRWGQLIVKNESGDAFENDDVEMHQVMNPIVAEV